MTSVDAPTGPGRRAEGFQRDALPESDPALPGLRRAVRMTGAEVVVYRPGRRAVVRVGAGAGAEYVKVVRPKRLAGIVTRARHVEGMRIARTPRVIDVDDALGLVRLSSVGERSLHEAGADPVTPATTLTAAWFAAGEAVDELHGLDAEALEEHSVTDELVAIDKAVTAAIRAGALGSAEVATAFARVAAELHACGRGDPHHTGSTRSVIHRDLHDKQLLLPVGVDSARAGLIDVDTLARGDRAIDIANLLVHIDLRRLQGHLSGPRASAAAEALRSGLGADDATWARVPAYARAARLRLAGVYAVRPGEAQTARALLAHAVSGGIRRETDDVTEAACEAAIVAMGVSAQRPGGRSRTS